VDHLAGLLDANDVDAARAAAAALDATNPAAATVAPPVIESRAADPALAKVRIASISSSRLSPTASAISPRDHELCARPRAD
jgi:hypothetical protein